MNEKLENFDWNYYLENNKDLQLNGINSKESALNHWINNGKNENRKYKFINNDNIDDDDIDHIDLKNYIEKFKYLEQKKYITKEDAWNLLVIIYDKINDDSYKEDMNYFDWTYYIKNNTDLYNNNILSKYEALNHWNKYGKNENRNHRFTYNISNDIDDIIKNYLNKISKYNNIDEIEMYDMNNFDWKYYIKNNKDLIECNIFSKKDAINHWNKYGKNEKRLFRFNINEINKKNDKEKLINEFDSDDDSDNISDDDLDNVSDDDSDNVSDDEKSIRKVIDEKSLKEVIVIDIDEKSLKEVIDIDEKSVKEVVDIDEKSVKEVVDEKSVNKEVINENIKDNNVKNKKYIKKINKK
jgi:hypothetical protein